MQRNFNGNEAVRPAACFDRFFPDIDLLAGRFIRQKREDDRLNAGKTRVGWAFSVQPNQEYRDDLASALNKYAAGGSWDEVKTAFVDNWATEKKANA